MSPVRPPLDHRHSGNRTPARSSSDRPLALVIEEDERGADIANSMLRLIGFDVIPVLSGADALHRIDRGPVDLLLMDAELNDMDGPSLIELARRLPQFERTRVVVASAVHGPDSPMAQSLNKLGIDGYVTKPYTLARMRHRLRGLFPQAHMDSRSLSPREAEALAIPGAVLLNGTKRPLKLIAASLTRFVVTGQQLPVGQVVEVRLRHRQEQFGELVTIDLVALGTVVSASVVGGSPMCTLDLNLARPPLEWDAMTEELPDP
jgi:CheY-like chemotaxis protein